MKCMRKKDAFEPLEVKAGSAVVTVYRVRHKTTRSGFVYAVSWTAAGLRKLVQRTTLEAALKYAKQVARDLSMGRIDAASVTQTDRAELFNARQLVGKHGLLPALREWRRAYDLTEGQIIPAAEAWAERSGVKIERVAVQVVIDRFLAAKTKAGKQTATKNKSIYLAIGKAFGSYNMDAVSVTQLERYLEAIEHPVSRNTHRKRIVTLWRWAQKQGYLRRDVKTEAEQTERAHEEAPVIGIIGTETYRNLLIKIRAGYPEYLAALVVAGFCGLRRSEIHGQTWEDINLRAKWLRVTKAKRGTPARRIVPLPAAAVTWLMEVPNKKGPICKNLAIDRVRDIGRGTLKFDLPENCFRHSFISHRVAQTRNVAATALEAGNSPQIIHRHYRELVTRREGAAWFDIYPPEAEMARMEPVPVKEPKTAKARPRVAIEAL